MMTPRRGGDESSRADNPPPVFVADYFEDGAVKRERARSAAWQRPDTVMGELVMMTPRRAGDAARSGVMQSNVFVADSLVSYELYPQSEASEAKKDETLLAI